MKGERTAPARVPAAARGGCTDLAGIVGHKPSDVPHEAAAVTTMAAMTGWDAIVSEARVKQGNKVLIDEA